MSPRQAIFTISSSGLKLWNLLREQLMAKVLENTPPTLIHTNQLCCAFHSTTQSAVISTQRSTRVWNCRRCKGNSRFSFLFRRTKILSASMWFCAHRAVLVAHTAVENPRMRCPQNDRNVNILRSLGWRLLLQYRMINITFWIPFPPTTSRFTIFPERVELSNCCWHFV